MIAQKSGFEKDIIAPAIYPAYCYALIGLGTIRARKGYDMPLVRLIFELPTLPWTDHETGHTGLKTISEKFPLLLGNRTRPSELAAFLQQWRGKEFTAEDYTTFDLRKILGAPACLHITAEVSQRGAHYNKIGKIEAAKKHPDKSLFCPGSTPSETIDFPPSCNPALYFDPADPDPQALERIPKWVIRELEANHAIEPPAPAPDHGEYHHTAPPAALPDEDDDDIPF